MTKTNKKLPRGRPATIDLEQIIAVGVATGLTKITFVGVAAQLGVSHMALYNHVKGLEKLKTLTAENIFINWPLPKPTSQNTLKDHLIALASSMWQLVEKHPGITPYLLRRDMITKPMENNILRHQEEIAKSYNVPLIKAHWLAFTISYHCLAVADTVLPLQSDEMDLQLYTSQMTIPGIDEEYATGIHALILGSLAMLDNITEKLPIGDKL